MNDHTCDCENYRRATHALDEAHGMLKDARAEHDALLERVRGLPDKWRRIWGNNCISYQAQHPIYAAIGATEMNMVAHTIDALAADLEKVISHEN